MAGKRFDSSDDPAFDLRAAAIVQAATVPQEAADTADAADGATTGASTPDGEDPATIEQIAADLVPSAEEALAVVDDAIGQAEEAVDAVMNLVPSAEEIADFGEDAAEAAYVAFTDVPDTAADAVEWTKEAAGDAVDWTRDTAADAAEWTVEAHADAADWTGEAAADAADWTKEAVSDAADWTGEAVSDAADWALRANADAFDAGADAAESTGEAVNDAVGWTGEAVNDAADWTEEAVSDAADWTGEAVSDGLDEIFGGGDEHPGESTFAVDPNTPEYTPEEYAAQRAEAIAERQAQVEMQESIRDAKAGDVQDAGTDRVANFPDARHGFVGDLDDNAGPGAFGGSGLLDPSMAGPGAAGATEVSAPDDAFASVAQASSSTAFGADVQLNPQPIPPGMSADIGEPAADAAVHQAPSVGDSSIIIVGGSDAPLLADHAPAAVALGADVQLNPQPIPPGMDLHPPSPCIGADIGEPAADVAVHQAPSVGDSSIIIVGGTEAPLLADDAGPGFDGDHDLTIAEPQMEEDIASTLAADADGPAFHAVDIDEAPIDVGITEDEFDS